MRLPGRARKFAAASLATSAGTACAWLKAAMPSRGLPRSLAMQSAVTGLGNGVFMTGSAVFFTEVVGLRPTEVGIGFSVVGLAGLLGSLGLGRTADVIGGKRAWIAGRFGTAAAFGSYPLVRGFWVFLCVIGLAAVSQVLSTAGQTVYSAAVLPSGDRIRVMAYARAYLNAGFTVGSGLGAAVLALRSPWLVALVLVNAAGMLLNTVQVARLPDVRATSPADKRGSFYGVLRDRPYIALSMVLAGLWLHQVMLSEVIPLWVITRTDAPRPLLGAVFVLNTVLVLALQVPMSRGADTKRGAARLLKWAGISAAAACPLLTLSAVCRGWMTIAVLAAAVLMITTTELWLSTVQWYVQTQMPPPGQRGVYSGVSQTCNGLSRFVGPTVITYITVGTSGWGWLAVAGAFAACAATARPAMAWVERTNRVASSKPRRQG